MVILEGSDYQMEKIKTILKAIGKALWSKPVLLAILVALCGVLGYTADPDKMSELICMLPAVSGCE